MTTLSIPLLLILQTLVDLSWLVSCCSLLVSRLFNQRDINTECAHQKVVSVLSFFHYDVSRVCMYDGCSENEALQRSTTANFAAVRECIIGGVSEDEWNGTARVKIIIF